MKLFTWLANFWGERKRLANERLRLKGYDYACRVLRDGKLGMHVIQDLERHILVARVIGEFTPFEAGIQDATAQARAYRLKRDNARVEAFQARMRAASLSIQQRAAFVRASRKEDHADL